MSYDIPLSTKFSFGNAGDILVWINDQLGLPADDVLDYNEQHGAWSISLPTEADAIAFKLKFGL